VTAPYSDHDLDDGPLAAFGALALATVLASIAGLLLLGTWSVLGAADPDDAEVAAGETPASGGAAATGTTTTTTTTTTTPPTTAPARPSDEVRVRVANGAQRAGAAGEQGGVLSMWGFPVQLANAAPRATSVVFHTDGFTAEAAQVAEILGIDEVAPLPADPGAPSSGVDVLVVLGADSRS
jgi:phosphohistidine swiveling domain-containing protein